MFIKRNIILQVFIIKKVYKFETDFSHYKLDRNDSVLSACLDYYIHRSPNRLCEETIGYNFIISKITLRKGIDGRVLL